MAETPLNARTDAILRRLVRRDANEALRRVIAKTRPEDVAAAMRVLTWSEQRRLYQAIDDRDQAADVLSMLSEDSMRAVGRELTEEVMVDLLDRMELDDATDVVSALPDELRNRLIAGMDDAEGAEVASLLAWDADTAGGIMSPHFFHMPLGASCGDAIEALQDRSDELEAVQYVYVLDGGNQLQGVASLRNLVVNAASTQLSAIMTRDPITVRPRDDQEEVARYVARYDLLAIPVVDTDGVMLGIVTVDDVVDVIREEAAEDMLRMAGLSEDVDPASLAVFRSVRQRAGWLLATVFGGIFAAEVLGAFESQLEQVAVLAFFIPVIMGMGGNVGIQSATVAVRGLATGHVQLGGAAVFVWREIRIGALLGLLYGSILLVYSILRYDELLMVGPTVGLSVFIAIGLGSSLGAGIPVVVSRFGIDPAIATGPIVTTAIDIIGIAVYFSVATVLLGI